MRSRTGLPISMLFFKCSFLLGVGVCMVAREGGLFKDSYLILCIFWCRVQKDKVEGPILTIPD